MAPTKKITTMTFGEYNVSVFQGIENGIGNATTEIYNLEISTLELFSVPTLMELSEELHGLSFLTVGTEMVNEIPMYAALEVHGNLESMFQVIAYLQDK